MSALRSFIPVVINMFRLNRVSDKRSKCLTLWKSLGSKNFDFFFLIRRYPFFDRCRFGLGRPGRRRWWRSGDGLPCFEYFRRDVDFITGHQVIGIELWIGPGYRLPVGDIARVPSG